MAAAGRRDRSPVLKVHALFNASTLAGVISASALNRAPAVATGPLGPTGPVGIGVGPASLPIANMHSPRTRARKLAKLLENGRGGTPRSYPLRRPRTIRPWTAASFAKRWSCASVGPVPARGELLAKGHDDRVLCRLHHARHGVPRPEALQQAPRGRSSGRNRPAAACAASPRPGLARIGAFRGRCSVARHIVPRSLKWEKLTFHAAFLLQVPPCLCQTLTCLLVPSVWSAGRLHSARLSSPPKLLDVLSQIRLCHCSAMRGDPRDARATLW